MGHLLNSFLLCLALKDVLILPSWCSGGPNLSGTVLNTNEVPVAGATVFIYSAGPRVGSSSFCPTCYADCRKSSVTDADGSFKIDDLDPGLVFKLLVVDKGFHPLFAPKTDPLKGPVQLKISPRLEEPASLQSMRGRILDPDGKPVARAVVEFDTFLGPEANCGGQCEGVDLMTVTDEDGKFCLQSEKKFDWMTIRVEASRFARKKFFRLSSDKPHDLKLSEGAMVTGRVIREGKPAKGVGVGLVSVDRSDHFSGSYDTSTNGEGEFAFLNVPPYQMYYVYTTMDSSKSENLIAPVRRVRVAADGTIKEAGELSLFSGVRLRGRVLLSDNKPLPPDTQLFVGREQAWDSRNVVLDRDGNFDLNGIPHEAISLGVSVRGYRLSDKNKSLDRLNGGTLVGRVESDSYVDILLEPGQFHAPDFNSRSRSEENPNERPLEGAPTGAF